MNMKLDTILFCIAFIVCQNINISAASNDIDDVHERNKRFVFLRGAGMGVSSKVPFRFLLIFFLQL